MIKIKNILLGLFLFLVFTFPRVLSDIKIVILCILLLISFLSFNILKEKISLKVILFYFLIIFFPLVIGFSRGNEYNLILQSFKIAFFYPILVYVMLISFGKEDVSSNLYFAAWFSLIISFIINLSTFLFYIGFFPLNLNAIFYPNEDLIGLNSGYVHIINSSFSYWIFTIPILYCTKRYKSKWDYFLLIIVFVLSILSGRRILVLPFFFVAFFELRNFTKLLGISMIIFILFSTDFVSSMLDFNIIIERFNSAILSTGDSQVRGDQQIYFYKYIKANPFFGYGLGSYMPDFLRNDVFKTAYENTYDYLIFERGVIFGLLTILYFIWLFYKVYINNSLSIVKYSLIFGSVSLLLASFTNPYWLSSFDFIVPLALMMRFSHKSA